MATVSSPSTFSKLVRHFSLAVALAVGAVALIDAQIPGRNVNMVSGDKWPDGDPYLQRQNEPSLAASTRNPLHLLGGSNDYRTVDLPGLPGGGETGDAWLGLYRSFDGGQRWQSTLLPGYPQDTSAAGVNSAMHGYQAGADPVVRPGTNGLFYYSGIVFDRGVNGKSRVFVTRFIDNNNKEAGDGIHYLGSAAVASTDGVSVPTTNGTRVDFIDKPWMAVDIPRGPQTCTINTPGTPAQQIPAGAVYLAYAVITTTRDLNGNISSVTGRIMFSRSLDCGATWSTPIPVSDPADPINQGVTMAVDPATGAVQLAWRRFGHSSIPDAVLTTRALPGQQFPRPSVLRQTYSGRDLGEVIKSIVGNRQKSSTLEPETPAVASEGNIAPFDQGTTPTSFRTNSYPTMAIDGGGRVYIAWSERGFRAVSGSQATADDSSVVMTTGLNGSAWNAPFAIDLHAGPGHQLMPSLAFAGGKLMLAYYDLREDISGLFQKFIDEAGILQLPSPRRRHTVDLRAAQATPAAVPTFGASGARSIRVSEYLVGSRPNSGIVEQLQFNPPNLPLFELGAKPFLGDYIDIAPAPAFVQNAAGAWSYNTSPSGSPVFHTAWTDNRDVKPPTDGNWSNYTPPTGPDQKSVFDPSKFVEPCSPGKAGMRNQNVYTAKLTTGLMVGSPGNSKPLSNSIPRAFVVFAQNTTDAFKWFRMTITEQPSGGWASFVQTKGTLSVDVAVPARSTVSKSVFAISANPDAKIPVSVVEIASLGGAATNNGLTGTVVLNPDISNPDISNPDISNPDISNPDISNAEVYNPDISNPDISNPDISNPDISNPDISNPDISNALILNPDISNPDISNPDISNPDISNPDISNPDISNPDISNGAITDYTWTVTNKGNTTSNYDVDVFGTTVVPAGIKTQIVIHKTYKTPVSDGCTLKQQLQTVLVTNVVNPQSPLNANVDLTLWLEPGAEGRITLRVIDSNPGDGVVFNPVAGPTALSPTVTSTAINTQQLSDPTAVPPSATPPTAAQTGTALSIVVQPGTTAVGAPLGNLQVRLMKTTSGSVAPVANAPVAVGIVSNPAGGHLEGTTTVATNADGYASFNTLSIDRSGQNYQLLFTASAAGAPPAASAFFTVTGTDTSDPSRNYFAVTSIADSGAGTLRQAIINANNTPNGTGGPDVIRFALHAGGPQRILLSTPLPPIVQPVFIDGATQTGYNAATGQPLVHLAGNGSNNFQGLIIESGATNTLIRGLSLTGFGSTTSADTTAAIRTSAADVRIEANWIGLSPTGLPMANNVGIWIIGGNPSIGGVGGAATRNVISNGGTGIYASGGANASIRGNYIGTTSDGLGGQANSHLGINVQPGVTGTVIGGAVVTGGYFAGNSPANLISANAGGGIELQANSIAGPSNTQILGNVIGLAANGSDLGNGNFGIRAQSASGTQIGAAGAGNVISGNGAPTTNNGRGIIIATNDAPPAVMPIIRGNRIGTSLDGTEARPNSHEGIILENPAVVGGTGVGEGNLISANGEDASGGAGIHIGSGTSGSLIQGNILGLSISGASLGNNSGIRIDGVTAGVVIGGTQSSIRGITIGGPAAGASNVISANRGPGINILGAASAVGIRENSIFNNAGLGIDIGGDGPDANDTGDADTGPNGRQNSPVLTAATLVGSTTRITGSLNSTSGVSYDIHLYVSPSCDTALRGEGQTYLASLIDMTAANGTVAIDVTYGALTAGHVVTATARNRDTGDSSEFSNCAAVQTAAFDTTGPVQWTTGIGANGNYYEYVRVGGLSWTQARAAAASRSHNGISGRLVTIANGNENQFVNSLRGTGDMRAWIGLYDPDGSDAGPFVWITGEPVGYTNWGVGEPNNLGTEFWVEMFQTAVWNNITHSGTAGPSQGYIVEYDPTVAPPPGVSGALTFNGPTRSIGSWTQNVAQTFQLTVNMNTKTTSLSINGLAVDNAQNLPFQATTLGSVSVELGTTGTQRLGWDDITVRDAAGSPPIFSASFTDDVIGQAPSTPTGGTWSIASGNGSVLVQSSSGNLMAKPVEIRQSGNGTNLLGTITAAPETGVWIVEWKSVMADPGTGYPGFIFAPIVIRGNGGIIASVEYR